MIRAAAEDSATLHACCNLGLWQVNEFEVSAAETIKSRGPTTGLAPSPHSILDVRYLMPAITSSGQFRLMGATLPGDHSTTSERLGEPYLEPAGTTRHN